MYIFILVQTMYHVMRTIHLNSGTEKNSEGTTSRKKEDENKETYKKTKGENPKEKIIDEIDLKWI